MFKIDFFVKGSVKKYKNLELNIKNKNLSFIFSCIKFEKILVLRNIKKKLENILYRHYQRYIEFFQFCYFSDFIKNFKIANVSFNKSFVLKRPFFAAKGKYCIRKKRFSFLTLRIVLEKKEKEKIQNKNNKIVFI